MTTPAGTPMRRLVLASLAGAAFAQAVVDAGLVWVGPPASAIELMGSKTAAKRAAEEAGVPVVPGVHREGLTDDDLVAFAADQEYPLLVKAAAGGGGRGMRVVRSADQLAEAVGAAAREAESAFGDGTVFVEPFIERGRHVEVQIVGDTHGNVVHLGERECSLQRRHQKVIEEAPSPLLDTASRASMGRAAVDAAKAVGWAKAHAAAHGGDPDRLFLAGHSAGAHIAAMLALDARYLAAEHLTPSALQGVRQPSDVQTVSPVHAVSPA